MSDVYETGIPAVRGRRDPRIQAQIEAEQMMDGNPMMDPGQDEMGENYVVLDVGDSVFAKISVAVPSDVGEAWFTYGTVSHVLPGEEEPDTFTRIAGVVLTRVMDLANAGVSAVNQIPEQRAEEARHHRIVPQNPRG